ncbi:ferritin-like domain-containing protein [Tabrizicola sp.]|uniref:ferritin-like domain-containing protein n=1 Tax=Tabrizicola sp. TaxID=2005166 RepID=UPI002FDC9B3E
MDQSRRTYLAWLRDAHAMEGEGLTMMQAMLPHLEHYPQLRARIESHLTETKEQRSALAGLLARHGSDASVMKDTLGKAMAVAQSVSGMFASDEVVKGMLASYTFEQMEIAAYRVLITVAEQMGDRAGIEVFTLCLEQEEAMAGWLAGHSAEITRFFLSRAELDATSAR